MLDLGWPEMLVIAIILIVVVGPKDLPKMLRAFGSTTSKLRAMAGDFRKQFDDAMKEAELDDLKNLANDARKLNPASELKKAMSPMEQAAKEVRAGLDSAMKPTQPAPAEPASDEARSVGPAKPGPAAVTGKPAGTSAADGAKASAAARPSRPIPEPAGAKRAAATAAAAASKTKPATASAAAKPTATSKPATKAKPAAKAKARTASAASKTGGTPS